ncbi:hypothetical protein PIB30_015682 [Stylosanthes scabra]|uniref:Uncharacterized protein n=1 Tax=Stylosanthes scabra TaxID=79078 RepID=A0ABU6U9S0_9FABA|nr:hypothetical protein [Stylosanthes scabra]
MMVGIWCRESPLLLGPKGLLGRENGKGKGTRGTRPLKEDAAQHAGNPGTRGGLVPGLQGAVHLPLPVHVSRAFERHLHQRGHLSRTDGVFLQRMLRMGCLLASTGLNLRKACPIVQVSQIWRRASEMRHNRWGGMYS